MNKSLWQRLLPHVIAIGIFFLVSVFYCLPAIKGLVVSSPDVLGWRGMAQQSFEHKEQHGHFPLWTNSMFSGMPAYQIAIESRHNVTVAWLHWLFTLFLPEPASHFFLASLSFYILCVCLRLNPWVGIFGALSYAYASYSAVLVVAGHTSKFAAMAYAPAIMGGLILLTQRKYVLGFVTTMLFATLMMYQNHVQIVYYTFLGIGCFAVAFAVHAVRTKQLRHLLSAGGFGIGAIAIALASYAVMLIPLREYAEQTMRGGRSELTLDGNQEKSTGGLDREYAFRWSYGISETLTLVLPAFRGGSSGPGELGEEGNAVQALQEAQMPTEAINYFYGALSAYWGEQPSTAGTVYAGAIVCFLFIIGLFVVRTWHLGWLVAATVISIILSWGKNLESINYFLFDYLPYYNKFRAPSMSLVMAQLSMPVLACLALQYILFGQWDRPVLIKKLKSVAWVTAGIIVILIFTYFSSDFKSSGDRQLRESLSSALVQMMGGGQAGNEQLNQQAAQTSSSIMSGVVEDRKEIFLRDLLRSIIFIALAAGLVWLTVRRKIRPLYAAVAFVAINLIDLIGVDSRYLNEDRYVDEDEFLQKFIPNRADLQIMQDTGYYRVFDQTGDPFNDSRVAYHHNDVAGYHPAKLALYQDLITHQLAKGNMRVYDMLNTKYFIMANPQDRQPFAQQNPGALGPAWIVKGIRWVNSADEEMLALNTFNPKDTAIVRQNEKEKISFIPQFDSAATIRLVENVNDRIEYSFNSSSNQFVVFSEVYYPYGWKAFIDGKEAPIVKVNYLLRGLAVPAGSHKIEFRFEPQSIKTGDTISLIIGIISILLVLFALWWEWRKYQQQHIPSAAPTAKS